MNKAKLTRKELRKILLIQWSKFPAVPMIIRGSTLFTGVNGSGKSTILDALTYAYTGNTQFNKAAQDRDRTVLSYVRGDTKSKGEDQYLRHGNVISYIVMEFFSPTDNKYITGGVCIESPDDNTCKPFWFVKADAQIDDFNFYKYSGNMLTVTPKNELRLKGDKFKASEFLGKDKGTAAFLRMLGLKNTNRDELKRKLNKMMSFQLENNINKFIMQSVLPESPITTIDNLKEQKDMFEKLKETYDNIPKRQSLLNDIETVTTQYENKQRELDLKQAVMYFQQMQLAKYDLDKIQKEIAQERRNSERLSESIGLLKAKQQKADAAQKEAYHNYMNNDEAAVIHDLEKKLDEQKQIIEWLKKDIDFIIKIRNDILSVFDICADDYETKKILEKFDSIEYSSDEKYQSFDNIKSKIDEKKKELGKTLWTLENDMKELNKNINRLTNSIEKLKKSQPDFPAEVVRAKDIINRELADKGIKAQVKILAELIEDITAPEWRDAIEVYLRNYKFNLIIDDEYVSDAIKIFHKHKFERVQLVFSDKITDPRVEENSAAGILKIPNKYARKYVDYLLGRLYLCNTLEELHNHPLGGIMTDGTLAKGYTMRTMNMSRVDYYIGRDAMKLQLEKKQREFADEQNKMADLKKDEEKQKTSLSALSKVSLENIKLNFDAVTEVPKLERQCETDQIRLEEVRNSPMLSSLFEIYVKSKNEFEGINQDLQDKISDQKLCDKIIQEKTEKQESLQEQAKETQSEYDSFILMHLDLKKSAMEEYDRLIKVKENGIAIAQKTIDNTRGERNDLCKKMEDAQIRYNIFAGKDTEQRGVSYISKFREERNRITNVEAEKVRNKLEEKRKVLENAFVTDFIAQLCDKVKGAEDQIKAINNELKEIPFGQDIYTFKPKERADKSAFFRIKNKIYNSVFGINQGYLDQIAEDSDLKQDIEDFMDMILSEDNDYEYTDYRSYYTYDMRITNTIGKLSIEADLSEKQGSASNGEKQTPYYIILAASLMQCYPKDSSCARLAFIDEAFAALSQDRIEQMVKYLEQNGFQVMYAAPPEKIKSIGSFIDSTVSLVETGRYVNAVEGLIDEFIKE